MSAPQSPFARFGLPERQALDAATLEDRYARLRTTLHPDKFVGASATERRLAEQMAADLNAAYQVLADPLRRASLILAGRGRDPFAEDASAATPLDPAFLEQQMELREKLEELRAAGEPAAAAAFAASLQEAIDADLAKLATLLDDKPAQVDEAVAVAQGLRYLVNCQGEAKAFAATS